MVPSALPPGASWISLISLLLFSCLLPPDAQGQAFQMRVELQPPAVLSGESILVNCSTDCPWAELVSLETSLLKELVGSGLGWAAFQLKNVTGDTLLFCYGFCNDSQIAAFSNITVYRFPERVELAPLPPWQPVGKRLLLSCLVSGGAPRDHLTVALFKGDEELGRQPAAKGEPTEVTVTVLASRDDHGANFSCRTELDLRSQGLGLFQNSSAPRKLQTFAMPMTPPRLVVSRFSEVETSLPVECTLDGLFPASEAQVQLVLGDQSLNPTVVSRGDTLTATATAKAAQEGVHKIVCKVTLGGKSLETRENVTVYSFQGPNLTLSEENVNEGTTVTVTCAAGPRVLVTLDGIPATAPGEPAQRQLNATERDDRRIFFCNATLEVHGVILHRNKSVQLRVLYGPKIDRAKCPQRLTWKERTMHILQCQARGNPNPQVQCLQEGSMSKVPVGILFLVTLNYSGNYHCQAASSRGMDILTVRLNVEGRNPLAVTITLAVLAILGLVIVAAALMYVFGVKKHGDTYQVN